MIDPPSPCNKVCQIDARPDRRGTGLCIGCARTLDEIAGWAAMTALEKQAVLDDLARRKLA